MKKLCFELTMPSNNSWNGKWSGEESKYYIIKSTSNQKAEELLDIGEFYYDFGDGWMACVSVEIIDAKEAKKRNKISSGFAGYDWMVQSIFLYNEIKPIR